MAGCVRDLHSVLRRRRHACRHLRHPVPGGVLRVHWPWSGVGSSDLGEGAPSPEDCYRRCVRRDFRPPDLAVHDWRGHEAIEPFHCECRRVGNRPHGHAFPNYPGNWRDYHGLFLASELVALYADRRCQCRWALCGRRAAWWLGWWLGRREHDGLADALARISHEGRRKAARRW